MADERRNSSYEGPQRREQAHRAQRPQPNRSASSAHSSYEEAIRRSNERLGNVRRSSRRWDESQQNASRDASSSYAVRRQQPASSRQQYSHERRTVQLDASRGNGAQQSSYTQQRTRPARQERQVPAQEQQRAAGLPFNMPNNLPNPFSRQQQGASLREQQLQGHSRNSGTYQSRRPSFPSISMPMQSSGTGFNGVVIRAVICLVLFIVVVFSITRIGPASATLNEAQSELATHQEALDNQNSTNETLQAQLEQMQQTIDKYNDLKASQS